jgi:hypothetical protein
LALGAAMVAVGIILPLIVLSAVGFVVLLLSGIWALNSWRQMATVTLGGGPANGPVGKRRPRRSRRGGRSQPARGSMMERFDERWRRRQEGGF